MKYLTYLIYILLWESATIGGGYYVVFVLGRDPLWMIPAIYLSASCFSPKTWASLGRGDE